MNIRERLGLLLAFTADSPHAAPLDYLSLPDARTYQSARDYHARLAAAMAHMEKEHVLPVHQRAHYWHRKHVALPSEPRVQAYSGYGSGSGYGYGYGSGSGYGTGYGYGYGSGSGYGTGYGSGYPGTAS